MRAAHSVPILAGLILAACAGGAPTRFHTLSVSPPPRPSTAAPYAGPPFRVEVVHIPASLDRPELVRDQGGGQFVVNDNDHWAGPLGDLLRQVLTQDLVARLPQGAVVYPNSPKPPGTASLVVDVLSIAVTRDGMVMQASWTWLPAHSASEKTPPPPPRQRTVQLSTPTVGAGVEGDPSELSDLTAQLSSAIAEDLIRQGV